jgi:hypothetical protein
VQSLNVNGDPALPLCAISRDLQMLHLILSLFF